MKLTMLQRLNVDALMSVQRGSLDELCVFKDIRDKMSVSQDDKDRFLKTLPTGQVLVDVAGAAQEAPMLVTLEKEERKRLLRLITEWRDFTANDLDWVLSLKKELEG